MFQTWRIKLKQAEQAFHQGRLEEAGRTLVEGNLVQYLPGKRLLEQVAAEMAARACRLAVDGETAAAWSEYESAVRFVGESDSLLEKRQEIVDQILRHVAQRLAGPQAVTSALAELEKMQRRRVGGEPLRQLIQVARRLDSSQHLMQRGRFPDALEQIDSAIALRGDLAFLHIRRQECEEKFSQVRMLLDQLHQTLLASDWNAAVKLADEILQISPEQTVAKDARRRAWAEVGARVSNFNGQQPSDAEVSSANPTSDRFLLWIDAVGGFLVCQSSEVVIGQATPNSEVQIPILADLSSRHAVIRRQGEGYSLEACHAVCINGRKADKITVLKDGDELEIGSSVRLRFRVPHPLSSSARLEFLSRHRPQPYCDGVLLMAESCVLGPRKQNHVVCRDWKDDVVLYREKGRLFVRALEDIQIDGRHCDGKGELTPQSEIAGPDFSITLEVCR